MKKSPRPEICGRIAQLRLETAGARGKSSFAKQLGLSPSTYDYYEATRVPPADVLVRIAAVAGADLRWLLTGEDRAEAGPPADHPVLRRAAALLAKSPDAAKPLAAFLDILAEVGRFPAKPKPVAGQEDPPPAEPDEEPPPKPPADEAERAAPSPKQRGLGWIPVLGRSAAGVAHFWRDGQGPAGLTTLDELIARHASGEADVRAATVAEADGRDETAVRIVTLACPEAGEVSQFVDAPRIKARWSDAFALRIDGDSMAPDIRHGDLAIVSPSVPAVDGRAAIVQLRGQIGVTCKLFSRREETVHLVPVNDRYEIATFPAAELVWALRVLGRVRP